MFCENCGAENPDDATYCGGCGQALEKNAVKVSENKNMILALLISFVLTGLGIAYAGNIKKGIILFAVGIIFSILGLAIPFCYLIGILIWAYALYETYNEVKRENGVENPNLLEDFKTFTTPKKVGTVIVAIIVVLAVIGGVSGLFAPHEEAHHTSVDYSDDVDLDDDSSSSLSGGSSESYSSSSDGREVSSHYEGEYGSADTKGHINDDGSVDSHQSGHTDYGDYEIDSHMDSNGNLHGTVNVGGQTYHVSSG